MPEFIVTRTINEAAAIEAETRDEAIEKAFESGTFGDEGEGPKVRWEHEGTEFDAVEVYDKRYIVDLHGIRWDTEVDGETTDPEELELPSASRHIRCFARTPQEAIAQAIDYIADLNGYSIAGVDDVYARREQL